MNNLLFLSNIPPPNNFDDCWLWEGSKNQDGYGKFGTKSAHRAMWELFIGKIPLGFNLCHKCDVRDCVNPNHLFLGTQLDNMRDCMIKGRLRPCNGMTNGRWKHGRKAKATEVSWSWRNK